MNKVEPITLYKTWPPSTNQLVLSVNFGEKSILQKVAFTNLHSKAYMYIDQPLQNNHFKPFAK
jgi:hypothetical protein